MNRLQALEKHDLKLLTHQRGRGRSWVGQHYKKCIALEDVVCLNGHQEDLITDQAINNQIYHQHGLVWLAQRLS